MSELVNVLIRETASVTATLAQRENLTFEQSRFKEIMQQEAKPSLEVICEDTKLAADVFGKTAPITKSLMAVSIKAEACRIANIILNRK